MSGLEANAVKSIKQQIKLIFFKSPTHKKTHSEKIKTRPY